MGLPIIQSSTWAMWFCDVEITPLARASQACLAGRVSPAPAIGRVYTLALASENDFASVLKDAEGPHYLSLRCVAFVSWAYLPS